MARSNQIFCGSDPKIEECQTEYLVGDYSRCLTKNPKCMYSYPAGLSCNYCQHHNHRKFERKSRSGSLSDAIQCF